MSNRDALDVPDIVVHRLEAGDLVGMVEAGLVSSMLFSLVQPQCFGIFKKVTLLSVAAATAAMFDADRSDRSQVKAI